MGETTNMGGACVSQKFSEAPEICSPSALSECRPEAHNAAADCCVAVPTINDQQQSPRPQLSTIQVVDTAETLPLKILPPSYLSIGPWVQEVSLEITLAELKLLLAAKCGVAVTQKVANKIQLWFSGYRLPDTKTVAECDELCEGSEITLEGMPLETHVTHPAIVDTWNCPACTLVNQNACNACVACDRSRPGFDRASQLQTRFDIIDANRNGILEMSELVAAFGKGAPEFIQHCSTDRHVPPSQQCLTSSEFSANSASVLDGILK